MEDGKAILEEYPKESRLHKIEAELTYCQLGTKSMADFFDEEKRRMIKAHDFHMAQFIGCTFTTTNPHKVANADTKEAVLDAGASRFLFDEVGVCIGINLAIADGLGHSAFVEENLETASVAKNAVRNFIETFGMLTDKDDFDFLKQLTKLSKSEVPPYNRSSRDTSLSGASIKLKESTYQAKFCHIGDGMVIVYRRKTNEVIILPAIHYDELYNEKLNPSIRLSPMSLSRATKDNCIIKIMDNLDQGDVIILMTDGYWSELDLEVSKIEDLGIHPKKPSCHILKREVQVKMDLIKKLMTSVRTKNIMPSALDYATVVHSYAMDRLKEKNRRLLAYASLIKAQNLANDDQRTIHQWMENIERESPLAIETAWFIQQTQVGDGKSIDPHFTQVRDLKQLVENELETGDDATLQVVVLPDPEVELLRRVVECPASIASLLPRIRDLIKLRDLPGIGEVLNEQQLSLQHPIYQQDEIQKAIKEITRALTHKSLLPSSLAFLGQPSSSGSGDKDEEEKKESPGCTIS